MDKYFKHYIRVDKQGIIIDGFSDSFRVPSDSDICINEKGGYQFRLYTDGAENPVLFGDQGIPLYKYDAGAVSKRSEDEIESERESASEEKPTQLDIVEAQLAYTSIVTGTMLQNFATKEKIAKWFGFFLWTADMVHSAAEHGVLKKSEAADILAA